MDAAWGPADAARGALAFVHIPPYARSPLVPSLALTGVPPCRHAIQALQAGLNHTRDPGLDRTCTRA